MGAACGPGGVELRSGAWRVRRERGEPGILVREVAAHFDPGANRARGEVEVIAEEGAAKGWYRIELAARLRGYRLVCRGGGPSSWVPYPVGSTTEYCAVEAGEWFWHSVPATHLRIEVR